MLFVKGLLQSPRWHPQAGVLHPKRVDAWETFTLPPGHVLMISVLHLRLRQIGDEYGNEKIRFFAGRTYGNVVQSLKGTSTDDPVFMVDGFGLLRVMVRLLSNERFLRWPSGFRLLFSFHQVRFFVGGGVWFV